MQKTLGAEAGTDYLAISAQHGADFLCDIRPAQAMMVAAEIIQNPDYQSWKLAAGVAVFSSLDKADGMLSRWAAKRLGIDTSPEGAAKDQENDKKWTHTLLGALAARTFMDGDEAAGMYWLANQTLIKTRDQMVNKKREQAASLGVDAKAQKLGKYKTGLQNLTFTVACSPLAKTRLGKKTVYALQSASTGLSVSSGRSLIESLDGGITEARLKKLGELSALV